MFCPFCGQPDGTPGLRCVRCGEELPRGKGGTVAVEDQVAPVPGVEPSRIVHAPVDLAPTFRSAGAVPVVPVLPFVPQVSTRAISHPGSDPEAGPLAPTLAPPVRPVVADPPIPEPVSAQPTLQPALTCAPTDAAAQVPIPAAPDPSMPIRLPQPFVEIPRCESQAGMVARAVAGSASLLSGATLLVLFSVLVPAWINGMTVFDAPSSATGVVAMMAAITGAAELAAGLRMLAGSPRPLVGYVLALLAQLSCSAGTLVVALWNGSTFAIPHGIDVLAAILAAALIPTLARMALLLAPTTSSLLGARGMGASPIRAVPLVLWAPMTAGLTTPLLPLLIVACVITIRSLVGNNEAAGWIAGAAVCLAMFAGMGMNLIVSAALLRHARWAMVAGGLSGLAGVLLGVLALVGVSVTLCTAPRSDLPMLAVAASLSLVTANVLLPSLVFAIGAIRFRFRLPAYADDQPATPDRPGGPWEALVRD